MDVASLRSATAFLTRRPNGWAVFRCRIVTSCPAPSSFFTSNLPMNSVPPITRTRIVCSPPGHQTPHSGPGTEARRRLDVLLVVVLESEVSNQLLALHPAEGILQFHELNEDIVLGIEPLSRHRRLEVEGKPLLNASHSRALRQIHKQHQIQNERRRKNRVTAQKIDLDLHRVAEPPENVDVIPTLLRIATGRVVVDTDLVVDVLV